MTPNFTVDRLYVPLLAQIASRRSIRHYRPDPVPLELVNDLLRVAVQAPSAHNRQPWRWVVVTTLQRRQHLAEQMGRDFARDLRRDGLAQEAIEQRVARSRARLENAPVVLIPCLTMADMDKYPDDTRAKCEWQMAVQSVALACQNLMLAAHAVGLGSCWVCAPIFCVGTVEAALNLATDWEPQGLITLGYPADAGRERPRKPLDEVVRYC